jgi:hypothetical protein
MLFTDRATIDGPARITRDGYLVADALVAQGDNVQDYMPGEIGQPAKADGTPYRIGRPASEVFADEAMASAAHRPITVDHPAKDVTAANWRDLGVGDIGGDIKQQGKFLRVPVKMMDASAIRKAQTTHREFSLGYSADLDMTPQKIGDADVDGVMRNIRINHLAIVPAARGGPELRIVDERPAHLRDHQEPKAMKIKIGDAEVDLTDGAAVALAVGSLTTKYADAQVQIGTLTGQISTATTTIEARDGEIVALKQQVEDAAITPAKLQQLADARAKVIDHAKKIGGSAIVTDGKTDAEIRKAAVTAKLGDKAKDMSDAAIEGAFAALLPAGGDTIRDGLTHQPVGFTDERTEYEKDRATRRASLSGDWRKPAAAAA